MRESGTINFNQKYPGLSAADAWVGESREEYQMEKMNGTENRAEIEELSIKFGKGLAEHLGSPIFSMSQILHGHPILSSAKSGSPKLTRTWAL